ncbi:MAG: hypothetical protein ACI9HK_005428 [Pirellulaceae bacterium]|jgi:hypothetical protein
MSAKQSNHLRPLQRNPRRGAATVEFAVIAPVLMTIVLGVYEVSRTLDMQTTMTQAVRDGARLGAMDRTDFLNPGQSTNEKMIQDVLNVLESNGLNTDYAVVEVLHEASDTEIDLDDPDNEMELFRLRAVLPYNAASTGQHIPSPWDFGLTAEITFRNGRAALVQ